MTFGRLVLGITGALFAGYGLACLFAPGIVAAYSGIVLPDASARTEVVAMYGGLQTGIGALFLHGAARPAHLPATLVAMVVVLASLGLARLFGLLVNGATEYNVGAVFFELVSCALGVLALRSLPSRGPAA